MTRYLFGTRILFIVTCLLLASLVRFSFPSPGLADPGKEASQRPNGFIFGEGFPNSPVMTEATLAPSWPAWLSESYCTLSGKQYDVPSFCPQGPGENPLQRVVHRSMQSLFVACGVYALVGGIGSRRANQLDDLAEVAFWKSIKHTANSQGDAKQGTGKRNGY
jgi:hypothetical protein